MPLQPPTKTLLAYLQKNPAIRNRIRAAPNKTLLYAGMIFMPAWKEIAELKRTNPQVADKETLPDVLVRIGLPGHPSPNLLSYVQDVERQVPWKPDGFALWRALSGIFAANAFGKVSFYIGSGVTKDEKVFAATEMSVLARNKNIDPLAMDLLEYYRRCLQNKQSAMNLSFLAG